MPIILCPFCNSETFYSDTYASYTCSICGAEIYPPDNDDDENTSWRGVWKDEQRYKRSIAKRGSGSRTNKRKRSPKNSSRALIRLYDT